ncbi:hypothetical protein CC2G_006078 [Coprinopsis cinerea AmutBmut pab1-1]|nr:hypothetical protein CC2G_006078 [Coprinopsis cinerea AmutBmut pab1-1]
MHRFRKKSDVKRSGGPAPASTPSQDADVPQDFLPPVSDFRTSLILPDLSRRFSLLRTPAGEPVTVDDLRSKFAEHRAKGSQHTISEEEEDMLLETFSRLRGKPSGASQENVDGSDVGATTAEDESGSNTNTTIKSTKGTSSATSSPSSRSTKRYSNNMFGSGRMRDYTYLRSVASSRTSASGSTKTHSLTPSEASSSTPRGNTSSIADSLRPSTPTGTSVDESVQSSPCPSNINDQGSLRSTSSSMDPAQPISAAEYRLQKSLAPAVLKRASLALESVIKELEDDVEEEIVMPRSTPIPRNHVDHNQHQVAPHQTQRQPSEASTASVRDTVSSVVVEAGMAISSDRPTDASDIHAHRGPSPVPTNATPGYIPGMPRPMTPRDFEFFADERSHSTTPRATSPMHSSFTLPESTAASVSISKMLRRDSTSSASGARQSPRPTTPLFLQRSAYGNSPPSMNGRHTPVEDKIRSYGDVSTSDPSSFDLDQSLSSSILGGRRRPASPLANPPFQSIPAGSPSQGLSISRPTTPSKIVWTVNNDSGGSRFSNSPSVSPPARRGSHSRDNSWTSDSGLSDAEVQKIINGASGGVDVFGGAAMGLERKPSGNGISAPALNSSGSYSSTDDLGRSWSSNRAFGNSRPTSPLNASVASQNSFSDASHNLTNSQSQNKHRSATPTQITPRSPSSPTFDTYRNSPSRLGKRSSKQNGPSSTSPFDLGPLPSLTLNSRANLSSSSLLSTGSSFHSWDDNNDRVLNIFDDIDAQPAWHDFSSDKSTTSGSETQGKVSSSNETTPDDDWEPEEIIRSYAGLKKADFATIQEKLVAVAKATEHRGSALRKRRPSTSQSNYSTRDHRVASPPPPASPVSNVHSMAREQQKAIEVQSLSAPSLASSQSSSSIDREFGLRRNLAQVLFGEGEDDRAPDATVTGHGTITANSTATANSTITGRAAPSATTEPIAINPNASVSSELAIGSAIAETSISELLESAMGSHPKDTPQSKEEPASPAPSSSYLLNRNPSTSRIPQSPQDQAVLAREIQQKAQAATLALHKPLNEAPVHTTLPRKRIDPSQISSPTLVSSSASVDTIPLKTPSLTASTNSGSLKIGSRFKRLRGSIRAKVATVDENASINSDTKSPPTSSQMATYDHDKLRAASGPNSSGPGDGGRYKVSVPSPPASAGPGLKGFMARFRTKRMTDIPQSTSSPTQGSPHIPAASFSPLSPSHKLFPASPTPSATHFASNADSEHAPVDSRPEQNRAQFTSPASPLLQQGRTDTDSRPEAGGDSDALQQLFAAANKIGIDQSALNDLLVRSGSISSHNLLSRTASTSHSGSSQGQGSSSTSFNDSRLAVPSLQQPNLSSSSGSDHTATPTMMQHSLSSGSSPYDEVVIGGANNDMGRRASVKTPEHFRRRAATDASGVDGRAVVRRTIIFVDPRQSTVDPTGVSRRASTKRRRTSVQSVSNRSVHDRVPTPPPSKTPIGKRFSHDGSPPVPQLPQSFTGQAENLLTVPTAGNDKNSATYDSVYELYGDSRATSMMVDPNNHDNRGEGHLPAESTTGVEVIELANGETIWKIVNGLRDDDDDSFYPSQRNSISSEYSTREGTTEGLQVFVKEHVRSGSKGSHASFLSRKKSGAGKARPDTKVSPSLAVYFGRLGLRWANLAVFFL